MRHNIIRLEGNTILNCLIDPPVEIHDPAVMIDTSCGCLHAWGPKKSVYDKYTRMTSMLTGVARQHDNDPHLLKMASDLVYIELSEVNMTPQQRCYILKRCAEMTSPGFLKELCRHIQADDFLTWLSDEMRGIPLDLTASD